MPRYMITRTLPELSPEELTAVGKKVVSVAGQIEGMRWIRSHITADGKHSFCEFEAPSPEPCREHAALSGLSVDDVAPLGQEIGPSLFE